MILENYPLFSLKQQTVSIHNCELRKNLSSDQFELFRQLWFLQIVLWEGQTLFDLLETFSQPFNLFVCQKIYCRHFGAFILISTHRHGCCRRFQKSLISGCSPGLYWAAISSYAGLLMCTFTTPAHWAKNKNKSKHSNIPIQENKQ